MIFPADFIGHFLLYFKLFDWILFLDLFFQFLAIFKFQYRKVHFFDLTFVILLVFQFKIIIYIYDQFK